MIMPEIFRYVINQKVKKARASERWTYGEMSMIWTANPEFRRKMVRLHKLITHFWDKDWWKY